MKKNILLTITIAALTLAACNDDACDNTAASAIPLQITAVVQNGTTTRTEVTGTSFDGGSSIGVTGGDRSNVEYTLNGTTWSSVAPIYYQDTSTKTFSAYYPYSDKVTPEGELVDVDPDDYLFASGATGSVGDNNVSFTFYHKMSKIALTFQKGTDVTDDDFSSISKCHICGVYTKGSFNTTDGTTSTSGNRDVQEVTTSFKGETLTGSAILYPQTAAGTDGIYVVVKVNNVNYKTTLIAVGNSLESGNVYSYTVTINKTGLTVTSSTEGITGWEAASVTNPDDAQNAIETFNDPEETRLYDLVFSDGSFVHLDTDENEEISDDELENLDYMPLSELVGIVLWKGNPITDETKEISYINLTDLSGAKFKYYKTEELEIGDPILRKACSGCTHGLIAGLRCAYDIHGDPTYMWLWENINGVHNEIENRAFEGVSADFQKNGSSADYGTSNGYLCIDGYNETNCNISGEKGTKNVAIFNVLNNLSRFMGYNNTQVIRGFSKYYVKQHNDGKDYGFMTTCLDYSYGKKISGSNFSEWFIPSMWELYVMLGGEEKSFADIYCTTGTGEGYKSVTNNFVSSTKNVYFDFKTNEITYVSSITSRLKKLGYSKAFDLSSYIWTSTEYYKKGSANVDGKSTDSYSVIFIKDTKLFALSTKSYSSGMKQIIPVCAF
jgi:hypothetical protein